jgi:hypothetical protein
VTAEPRVGCHSTRRRNQRQRPFAPEVAPHASRGGSRKPPGRRPAQEGCPLLLRETPDHPPGPSESDPMQAGLHRGNLGRWRAGAGRPLRRVVHAQRLPGPQARRTQACRARRWPAPTDSVWISLPPSRGCRLKSEDQPPPAKIRIEASGCAPRHGSPLVGKGGQGRPNLRRSSPQAGTVNHPVRSGRVARRSVGSEVDERLASGRPHPRLEPQRRNGSRFGIGICRTRQGRAEAEAHYGWERPGGVRGRVGRGHRIGTSTDAGAARSAGFEAGDCSEATDSTPRGSGNPEECLVRGVAAQAARGPQVQPGGQSIPICLIDSVQVDTSGHVAAQFVDLVGRALHPHVSKEVEADNGGARLGDDSVTGLLDAAAR